MRTREIWHEIHLRSSPQEAYAALTEPHRLAGRWTTDVHGISAVGEKLQFCFGGRLAAEMLVTELVPGSRARWHVGDRSIPQWVDTEIAFDIFRRGDRTIVHLRHANRRESADMFPECSMHWAIYLLSFKEFVETGKARPHPHDLPVNV